MGNLFQFSNDSPNTDAQRNSIRMYRVPVNTQYANTNSSNVLDDCVRKGYEIKVQSSSWNSFGSKNTNLRMNSDMKGIVEFAKKFRFSHTFCLEEGYLNKVYQGSNFIRHPIAHTRDSIKNVYKSILKFKCLRRLEICLENKHLELTEVKILFEHLAKNPALRVLKIRALNTDDVSFRMKFDFANFLFKSIKRSYFKNLHTFYFGTTEDHIRKKHDIFLSYNLNFQLFPINFPTCFLFIKRVRKWKNFGLSVPTQFLSFKNVNKACLLNVRSLELVLNHENYFDTVFGSLIQMKNLVSLTIRKTDFYNELENMLYVLKCICNLEKLNDLKLELNSRGFSKEQLSEHFYVLFQSKNLKILDLKLGGLYSSIDIDRDFSKLIAKCSNKLEVLKFGIAAYPNSYSLDLAKIILTSKAWKNLKNLYIYVLSGSLKDLKLREKFDKLVTLKKEGLNFHSEELNMKDFKKLYKI